MMMVYRKCICMDLAIVKHVVLFIYLFCLLHSGVILKRKGNIGVTIMCLEVHLGFDVLAGDFVSHNNYFGYRQTRLANLDILTSSKT